MMHSRGRPCNDGMDIIIYIVFDFVYPGLNVCTFLFFVCVLRRQAFMASTSVSASATATAPNETATTTPKNDVRYNI